MKKLLAKVRRKTNQPPSRITNETVAEHREKILAGGRRFKYPVQYARHRLVINAIIISLAAVVVLSVIGWWRLYLAQDTGTFMYRVTKVLPLPVASVDGYPVLYSDYLMKYRSDAYYLETKEQVSPNTPDGKKQLDYSKQKAMQDAIADAYAKKLAGQLNITVSSTELEAFLKSQRQSSDGEVSQQTYDAVILDYYNWSPDEYRSITSDKLLRRKVAYAVDKDASALVKAITPQVQAPGSNFQSIVAGSAAIGGSKATYGASGWVPKNNTDGGLASAASKLGRGQVSGVIESTTGDGYYFVRLLDINDSQVSYEYIKVPLSTFDKDLASLKTAGKIKEYISVPSVSSASSASTQ